LETLITLGIIGIIAAITLTPLINSVKNAGYESTLKKNYSVLTQAYNSYQADGNSMTAAFPGTDTGAVSLNKIAPYLKIVKNCGLNMGCWYDTPLYNLNGTEAGITDFDLNYNGWSGKAILADGTMIMIYDFQTNCTSNKGTGPLLNTCADIVIDVNGAKGPNTAGRDYFGFWITQTGIYPYGTNGDQYVNSCNLSLSGEGCTFRVLTTGMNY